MNEILTREVYKHFRERGAWDTLEDAYFVLVQELERRPTREWEHSLQMTIRRLTDRNKELVQFYDKHNGTPCEQIRHQQEIENLVTEYEMQINTIVRQREKLKEGMEDYRQTILRKDEQLRWYAEGITLLVTLMNGRGIVAEESAERKVFEAWRNRGQILEHANNTGTPEEPVSPEYNESDTLP